MEELYWITRLDGIRGICVLIFTICLIVMGIILFHCFIDGVEKEDEEYKPLRRIFNISLICFIISVLVGIFTPSTKDMLLIYGVGGTYDWVKDNDKVKELPDKCIHALDKLIEDYLNEE